MQTLKSTVVVALLLFLLIIVQAQETQVLQKETLNENLRLLEPLINKKWVFSKDLQNDNIKFDMTREWKPIWNGKAIRYLSGCTELNSQTEGFIYFDSDLKQISFFIISNKDNYSSGFIEEENGKIIMHGYITFSEGRAETKNTYKITPEGKLIDINYSLQNGVWKVGHMGEFEEK